MAPGPPLNRVSPLNTTPSRRRRGGRPRRASGPGCGGRASSWPPAREHVAVGEVPVRRAVGVDRGPTASASSGCSRIGAPVASARSAAALMWSLWPWVHDDRRPPCGRRPPSTIGSASWAASITSTSASSPTSQMLLSTSKSSPSMENMPEVTTRSMRTASDVRARRPSAAPRRAPSCGRPPRPRRARSSRYTNRSRSSRPWR